MKVTPEQQAIRDRREALERRQRAQERKRLARRNKGRGGEPKMVFDPQVGRLVPLPKREPAPRGFLFALWGIVGCILVGALTGLWLGRNDLAAVGAMFMGGSLGLLVGIALALLAPLIGRAVRRSS